MGAAVHFEWVVVLGAFAVVIIVVQWLVRRAEATDNRGRNSLKPDPETRPVVPAQAAPAPARPASLEHKARNVRQDEAPLRSEPEIVRRFHARLLTDSSGTPISSENRAAWLSARRKGVTATDVGKIVKLNGTFSSQRSPLMEAKLSGQEQPFLQVMQHGIDREPVVAAWVAEMFGIQPNTLICRGENPRHLATPDGIGAGVVAEIKTSTKPLDQALGVYRDQLQWQLHVTGSKRLLFVVENRHTLRKETRWVDRDEYRIFILAQHADAFMLEMDERRATARPSVAKPVPQSAGAPIAKFPTATATASSVRPLAPTPAPVPTPLVRADEDETRTWSAVEREELTDGYARGASIAMLALSVGTTPRAVVFELSRLWLEPEGQMVDPTAARFRCTWTLGEEQALRDLYSAGIALPRIARQMQRDQLGIAFRLFENHIPRVPEVHRLPSTVPAATPIGLADATEAEVLTESAVHVPTATATAAPAEFDPAPRTYKTPTVRPSYEPVPPETTVGGLDPDNDLDDNRSWSPAELRRLLELYGDNEDLEIFEIARHFRTTSRAVAIALTHQLLEPQGPLEDPLYPKRKQPWTVGEVDALHDSYRAGATLQQIAQALQRDQLSVAFKLFGERLPDVSGLFEEFQTA